MLIFVQHTLSFLASWHKILHTFCSRGLIKTITTTAKQTKQLILSFRCLYQNLKVYSKKRKNVIWAEYSYPQDQYQATITQIQCCTQKQTSHHQALGFIPKVVCHVASRLRDAHSGIRRIAKYFKQFTSTTNLNKEIPFL